MNEGPFIGVQRRLPVGAEVVNGRAHLRVWAPRRKRVTAVIEGGGEHVLGAEPSGYFSGFAADLELGGHYRFRLDDGDAFPDPASRFQPDGPHGPSEVIDPALFRWSDAAWRGVTLPGQVLYEMHVGTFTTEGTWAAAAAQLERLRGICTVIEMMPVAEFAGDFGWGYDGVNLFAPTHLYGRPDDLRAFVDRAHELGFGVILDVVYNHLGPDGNYLAQFSNSYMSSRHKTEWGCAINYDGGGSEGVRELIVANAGYWIDEYHFDGLRLDATQSICDDSNPHVISEIAQRVRAAAGTRNTLVIAENEPQHARLVRPREADGYGLDAIWNDDFHHSALVALTGRSQAYFSDYRGTAQELVSAVKHGFLYQGQRYDWQKARRGSSTRGLMPEQFVTFLENHDQVANTARAGRLTSRTHPGRLRALKALLLLGPGTPMLFQGEEFASSACFEYFAHHSGDLALAVRAGRAAFLAQFPSYALDAVRARLKDPAAPATFANCKIDWADRERNAEALALHRDLFALRQSDPTVRAQGRHGLDGAVLAASAFVLRLFGTTEATDRLLLVNLGPDLRLVPAPEPLLAPPSHPRDTMWSILWSSEDPRYGGEGMPAPDTDDGWIVNGESAVLLQPAPRST
ncbi:MAG: malto-oligosyltrehalose trehalohydrolase [Myxococcota bacterium]|nr:malto-oligosyltrehalose trehalohydrolase [Myxococcota bacterium]